MQLERLGDLFPNRMQGVERSHGLLKNHGHARTSQAAQSRIAHLSKLRAIQCNRPRNSGPIWQQSHDGQGSE